MQNTVYNFLPLLFLLGVAGIYIVGLYIYKFINKQAHEKQLAELRKQLKELKPTDPEYNQVRALYASIIIDAHTSPAYFGSSAHDSNTSNIDHTLSGDTHSHSTDSDN